MSALNKRAMDRIHAMMKEMGIKHYIAAAYAKDGIDVSYNIKPTLLREMTKALESSLTIKAVEKITGVKDLLSQDREAQMLALMEAATKAMTMKIRRKRCVDIGQQRDFITERKNVLHT